MEKRYNESIQQSRTRRTALHKLMKFRKMLLAETGKKYSVNDLILKATANIPLAAGGAILGVTVGTILSLAFLIVYLVTHHSKTESLDTPDPSGTSIITLVIRSRPF